MQPAWRIPNVGALYPRLDRVVIVSTASVGTLKALLPIAALEKAFHSFKVVTYTGRDRRLRAKIITVGAGNYRLWTLLKRHEKTLQQYRITEAELAYDVSCYTLDQVKSGLNGLVMHLDKRWHQRQHLHVSCEREPRAAMSAGHLPDVPTIYYERRRSSVAMKCYGRKAKLPGGRFGRCIIRLEWTLKGERALVRHLGGNQITDLLAADLNAFLKRNLRLARVDHAKVGQLFSVKRGRNHVRRATRGGASPILKQWSDPKYRARRTGFLALRLHAYGVSHGLRPTIADFDHALQVCQGSPAQVRGYLRSLRTRGKRLTDYKINRCFRSVGLLPV